MGIYNRLSHSSWVLASYLVIEIIAAFDRQWYLKVEKKEIKCNKGFHTSHSEMLIPGDC